MSTTPLDRLMDEAREAKRVEVWVDLPSGEMTAIHILLDRLVRIVEVQREALFYFKVITHNAYRPDEPIPESLPPMFYHTLRYEDEVEFYKNMREKLEIEETCNRIAEGKEE